MRQALAIVMLVLGLLSVGLSSLAYLHARQIMLGGPSDILGAMNQFDVSIMTIGMVDSGGPVDVAAYCRDLARRVYGVFGAGLGLLVLGAALLTRSRNDRREPSDEGEK